MKPENWIVIAGLIFGVFVLVAAVLPDQWMSGGKTKSAATSTSAPATTPAAPVGTATQNPARTGLIPFTRAKTRRFDGKVMRLVSRGNATGWGQIHVWIDAGTGPAQELSVAPEWYLQHLGCAVADGARVRGVAFVFDSKQNGAEIYAKNITVNGNTCRLRNDEGFALWSNRLQ